MADHAHAHETPETHLYLHGKPLEDFEECHEHISPKSLYWKVFGALMVLTVSGVLLWSRLRPPRLLGIGVLLTVPILTFAYLTV